MSLTYDALRDAVAGEGVGIRARTELEPLGGPGDKVFPPTYAVSNDAEPRYAIEPIQQWVEMCLKPLQVYRISLAQTPG